MNWFAFLNFTRLVNVVAPEFIMKNQVMLCCVAGSTVSGILKDHSVLVLQKVRQAPSTQWHGTTNQGSQLFRNSTV